MGIGKSTISERLARHLYCKVVDLDKHIELIEGLTIEEIFSNKGEPYFRNIEEFYLNTILAENEEKVLVLSLGGGTLISKLNQKLIKEKTFCIYLKASLHTQISRLSKSRKSRPNLGRLDSEEFGTGVEQLFERRREGYEYCSSLVIEVDDKPLKNIISEILSSI